MCGPFLLTTFFCDLLVPSPAPLIGCGGNTGRERASVEGLAGFLAYHLGAAARLGETFRVPSPMSKILDGVARLAASLGSVFEDVVIIVVIILIINIGCHDRTEL